MGAYSKRLRSAPSAELQGQHYRFVDYRYGLTPRHAYWHTSPSSTQQLAGLRTAPLEAGK